MAAYERLVYLGAYYTIEWGTDARGACQARDYYDALTEGERAKALALFKRMADMGKIYDETKFVQESKKLYAFKTQAHRFFNFFVKGKRIVIVSAYRKQGQKMPARELARAEFLMRAWLDEEAQREKSED